MSAELLPFEEVGREMTPAEGRAAVLKLEAAMRAMPERQVQLKVTHHFAPGVYMRELFIPKGVTLTGKVHKTEHLNILSQGKLKVMTESGVKLLTASTVIKSQPGIKRAGYAIEDSVWITVHANPLGETDPEKLESILTAETFEEAKLIEGDSACRSLP